MLFRSGTFYLTDFLLRHFERLVVHALGIDRHPELLPQYFGHYKRLVFLAQLPPTDETTAQARSAADRLGLLLEVRHRLRRTRNQLGRRQ